VRTVLIEKEIVTPEELDEAMTPAALLGPLQ
jgi:hypothetical protein